MEKKVKDDFNYFMPVKFENEKEDNLIMESDQELHKYNTKKTLAKQLYDSEISKIYDAPITSDADYFKAKELLTSEVEKDFRKHIRKYDWFYKEHKMSHEEERMPKELLPSTT